jgi:hypothetical protein
MQMFQKNLWIDTNEEYTFKVSTDSNVVKVQIGQLYIGWVSNGDSSGGMPEKVSTAARAFLYEVKPELDPAVIFKSKEVPPAVAAKPKLGDCCDGMRLVLPRTELLQHKHGISILELINTDTGIIKRYVSLKFPKNPDKLAPHAKTTTIALNFCPFCGAKLEGESEASFEETEEDAGPPAEAAVPAAEGDGRQKGKARGGARKLPTKRGNTTGRSRSKK